MENFWRGGSPAPGEGPALAPLAPTNGDNPTPPSPAASPPDPPSPPLGLNLWGRRRNSAPGSPATPSKDPFKSFLEDLDEQHARNLESFARFK